jgi:hypothetical protein
LKFGVVVEKNEENYYIASVQGYLDATLKPRLLMSLRGESERPYKRT